MSSLWPVGLGCVAVVAVFVLLPILVLICSKAAALGWLRGQQTFRNYYEDTQENGKS